MLEQAIIPPALGVVGLVAAFVVYALVKRYPEGGDNVRDIGDEIHLGRWYSCAGSTPCWRSSARC